MKLHQVVIVAVLAALAALGGNSLLRETPADKQIYESVKQPAFDRVIKTRTIRCGYFTWYPYLTMDPNTKQMSGFAYDIMEQVGHILGMKIEWTEEVPLSQIPTNLMVGRNDVMCNTLWPSGNRAPYLDFTMPILYVTAHAYVRIDDKRFDGNLARINAPDVSVAVIDGDYSQAVADEDFPQAKKYSITEDSDGSQLLMNVASKKADVVFVDMFVADEFMRRNPGKLKAVVDVPPVRTFGDSYSVNKGETKLRDMIDATLHQMNQSGYIRQTLDKYLGEYNGKYYYPALPYAR